MFLVTLTFKFLEDIMDRFVQPMTDSEEDQPYALRADEFDQVGEAELLQEGDEALLQAAILQELNEDKYQKELEGVLALSLQEDQQSIHSFSNSTNRVMSDEWQSIGDEATGWSELRPVTADHVASEISDNGSLQRRPSLERIDGSDNYSVTKEEEYSREIAFLLRQGILKSDELPQSVLNNLELHVGSNRVETDLGIDKLNPVDLSEISNRISQAESLNGQGSRHLYNLSPLQPGSDIYDTISHDFNSANLRIIAVEQLDNSYLLEKFKSEENQILRCRTEDFKLNCRYLYHGTMADKMRVCEEGLDARLSRFGCFGKGIYFSDNPRKCVQYTEKESGLILMCRVILGDIKVYASGAKDRDLRREPEKTQKTHGWRFYDSVMGKPVDYNEYVVYENRRAMIEYIITYQVDNTDTSGVDLFPTASQTATASSAVDHSSASSTSASSASSNTVIPKLSNAQKEQLHSSLTEDVHMKFVDSVRYSVRKKRCEERGEVWTEPSEEQKIADQIKWKTMVATNLELTTDEDPDEDEVKVDTEQAAIEEVVNQLIVDFISVTKLFNTELAKTYILSSNMDLNCALEKYFADAYSTE